jgi:branched-chain amino acid transport system ATP-binding protein
MTAPLLELRGIDSFYGPIRVHFEVSLQVRHGQVVCLLGGNASGKSTAMKTVLGLLRPRAGRVLFDGRDITGWPTSEVIRAGIGSVPEARRLFPAMSVRENLLMGAFSRSDSAEIARDAEKMLALFPRLAERLGQAAGTLSGGEQQMLAMARALMSRPKLVCMDEPTMGLSPLYVDRVLALIRDINDDGVSVFMVEQNASLALRIAHYGYVLQSGRIVLSGPADALARDPRIRDAYLGGAVAA